MLYSVLAHKLKKYIQNSIGLESNYKRKFISIINSYKPINLSSNLTISFSKLEKKKSLFQNRQNRHASLHFSKNMIKNKLDGNNQGTAQNETFTKKETHGPFKKLPKIVDEFMGGFKTKRKKTLGSEINQVNIDIVSENDTWANSEIKSGNSIVFMWKKKSRLSCFL